MGRVAAQAEVIELRERVLHPEVAAVEPQREQRAGAAPLVLRGVPQRARVAALGPVGARFAGQAVKITLRESARDALVNGRWDAIGELIEGIPSVKSTAAKLPYLAA